jgi:foldase protein PrsA
VLALLLCTALLSACGNGGGSPKHAASSPGSTASSPTSQEAPNGATGASVGNPALNEPVASVSGKPITRATLRGWMMIAEDSGQQPPEPPDFSACVASLQAGAKGSSAGTLKEQCQKRYEKLLAPALSSAIHEQWLLGEAREEGLRVDQASLEHEFALSSAQPQYRETLAATGQSAADFKAKLALTQLSNQIYKGIERRTPKLTPAVVASFYEAHKRNYAVPELRDLHIIRTVSESAAQKVLSELRSGRSFASIAKEAPPSQPIGSKDGLLRELPPNGFSQAKLIDSIFRAPLKKLEGPVRIPLGYYVYEVIHITPAHRRTLAEVRATLATQLPEEVHKERLAAFVRSFTRKWTSRTDCKAGYVVEDCRQYRAPKGAVAKDPYTF